MIILRDYIDLKARRAGYAHVTTKMAVVPNKRLYSSRFRYWAYLTFV